ncbi:DNA-binding protein [Salmonella enterica subsp. enterica serovar Panama]|uniref:Single-stranded DNA-binding protein n=1 Tax=Salmonella enterica subsp. enterica serovar Panama TaxID=29472 RepID=A0A619AI38_SALET|nr:DNA-binding protein [Salmonella enterica subsp. enterica serovar Panama]ECX3498476.1 DNA-binding protein [Salmonella enterica subsp. enterica serovar Panama]ECX6035897.1 DNA-binding protein [Salmonella enterica subsp. enterica serovar Panama]EGU5384267.1 DNA-binding protein [Salmonella enterica]EGX1720685.1 DNA-binding protein [Salmonella enterica subsp. enterica serovar Panama]
MIKIEIKPSQVDVTERSGEKNGKKWSSREQHGYIYNGGDYPALFLFRLQDGQPPYAAGFYELVESSIEVGEFKRLTFSRSFALRPIQNNKA